LKPALLDASAIVVIFDASQESHERVMASLLSWRGPLATVEPVIAESCHLLRRAHGAPEAVLRNVGSNVFEIPFRLSGAAAAVERLLQKYRDQPISLADACRFTWPANWKPATSSPWITILRSIAGAAIALSGCWSQPADCF
jgi:predicted nucleic acid-binding protein